MGPRQTTPLVVAGVDVGGSKKGFHCVALQDGAYLDQFKSTHATDVVAWCRKVDAQFIGVDAPCRWSFDGRARAAERKLMQAKIWCFSTPTCEAAEAHPKDHFRWMLNGAELYRQLERSHSLFVGESERMTPPVCFETFPHAVACALAGTVVSAKQKRSVRRELLKLSGVDISKLKSIDTIDAALCALTAHHAALRQFTTYGEASTGTIVVPSIAIAS